MTMTEQYVGVRNDDPAITVLTLQRPQKRNALCVALMQQLRDAINSAGDDPARRAIIIQGDGPAFCAGLDLREIAASGHAHRSHEALAEVYRAICASPLIVIGSVHGAAFGGGAGLLLACDLVVAADDLQIGFPEVYRGMAAALVTCLLARQVGDRTAREIVLLGQTLDAATAHTLGVVNRIVPKANLQAAAMDLSRQICRGAPQALARSKRFLNELTPPSIDAQLQHALSYHLAAADSAEAIEGIAAFLEKRPPKWPPG